MTVYLHDIPLQEAQLRLETALREAGLWGVLGEENIPLDEDAVGRVLSQPVWARISSPHYHAAAMDGFALRAADTVGALPNRPVTLKYDPVGGEATTVYVDTGDALPVWADAVVPIENVEPVNQADAPSSEMRHPQAIRIRATVTPWSHVRPMGEDMVATQLVLPAGSKLRPVDLGAIAACGHTYIQVARQPRVAILPTGSELAPIGQPVKAGEIIEFNSLVLAAQVKCWGGKATRYPITPDNFEAIRSKVAEAASEHDLILLNAGSSAGSEDFSAQVVRSMGELLVHGVAVRPGHPVILGMIESNRLQFIPRKSKKTRQQRLQVPIIGVPGYPVSAALTGEIFVEPLLFKWLGQFFEAPVEVDARLTRKVTSPGGDEDYMRVAVGKVGQKMLAAPLSRGSGVITSLVKADGIVVIPRGTQGLQAGSEVKVRLYRSIAELEKTIFVIGSHDITLDLMAQYLARRDCRLVSANVGSLGGLVALKRGEAHFAGSHLLDPITGEYNTSYIHHYLPGVSVKLVALVDRQQGLIVQKGNPKRIYTLEDIQTEGVTFVNRQRGAGTRILFDFHLNKLGIAPEAIRGYNHEEYTHLAVAAAVASGRADCTLGIAAAAQALELDFVPLYKEHYDLVIPTENYKNVLLAPMMETLMDRNFRESVAALAGYDVSRMGTLVAEVI